MKKKIMSIALTGTMLVGGTQFAMAEELPKRELINPIAISAPIDATQFEDIDSHWAYEFIVTLEMRNILSDIWSGNFEPSKVVTKAEIAQLLENVFHFSTEPSNFNETPLLKELYENEDLDLSAPITRIEVAQLVNESFRARDLVVFTTLMFPVYEDTEDLSGDASAALSFVFNAGIMKGLPNNTFNPHGSITRAEIATVLARTLNTVDIAESMFDEEVAESPRMKGIITELTYDEEDKLINFVLENNGDDSQLYDKAIVLITENTLNITGDLEEGAIVDVVFVDGPVAMIYPVRIQAETITVLTLLDSGETTSFNNVLDEYYTLLEEAKTKAIYIKDAELRDEAIQTIRAIELTRDGYENKIRRLEILLDRIK